MVLPIDEQEEFRYKFLRFFLTLWHTYYTPESWRVNTTISGQPPDPLPQLVIGVAHFAHSYNQLLPLTNVQEISQKQIDDLSFANAIAQQPDTDWSCFTDYEDAISQANESLLATGMPNLKLVLITDGLFRGSEKDAPNQTVRAEAAQSLKENVVAVLTPVEIDVLLLGRKFAHHLVIQRVTC